MVFILRQENLPCNHEEDKNWRKKCLFDNYEEVCYVTNPRKKKKNGNMKNLETRKVKNGTTPQCFWWSESQSKKQTNIHKRLTESVAMCEWIHINTRAFSINILTKYNTKLQQLIKWKIIKQQLTTEEANQEPTEAHIRRVKPQG